MTFNYNFKPAFVDAIASGTKRQTIRPPRKRGHATVGDELQFYTGMRTAGSRLIGRSICTNSYGVRMQWGDAPLFTANDQIFTSDKDLNLFANRDGFDNWTQMEAFFVLQYGGDSFEGVLIKWGKLL